MRSKLERFVIVRRRTLGLLLALIGTISITVFIRNSSAQSPDELPGAAELKKGEYDEAIKLLGARLASNAADGDAAASLARAYLETGKYAEAEAATKKFLLKNPGAGVVRHQLAEVLTMTGRYAEAIAEFEKAATDSVKSPAVKLSSDLTESVAAFSN